MKARSSACRKHSRDSACRQTAYRSHITSQTNTSRLLTCRQQFSRYPRTTHTSTCSQKLLHTHINFLTPTHFHSHAHFLTPTPTPTPTLTHNLTYTMCNHLIPNVEYRCGHPHHDGPLGNPMPCHVAEATNLPTFCPDPKVEYGGKSIKRNPCADCIDNGTWIEAPDTGRMPDGTALSWVKS